jgi:hypothetical protein
MKKTFRILGLALVATGLLFAGCNKAEEEEEEEGASTSLEVNVSQTPSTKTVLIEEFTGDRCGYCPYGHKYANEVSESLGDKCCVINYHVKLGELALHYRTQFGTTLNGNFNVENGSSGIPAALFNRTDFSGSGGKITKGINTSSNTYSSWANQVAAQQACANIAATAVINKSSRQLTVRVKVYYTADGTGSSNKLNVAIIQNNIMGTQSGASANPAQGTQSEYRHMEVFRDFLTGQWGEAISPVTQGTTIDKTYTYTIPEAYTDTYGNTSEPAVLENLEVIAFVAEGNTNVINACKAKLTLK